MLYKLDHENTKLMFHALSKCIQEIYLLCLRVSFIRLILMTGVWAYPLLLEGQVDDAKVKVQVD